MFDIGFSELLVIALVALVVLGPERLPKAARMAGMWMRRARMQWQAVKSELENELADEDMRRSIHRAREELREAQESLRADGARLRAQLADVEARMTGSAAAAVDAPLQGAVHGDAALTNPMHDAVSGVAIVDGAAHSDVDAAFDGGVGAADPASQCQSQSRSQDQAARVTSASTSRDVIEHGTASSAIDTHVRATPTSVPAPSGTASPASEPPADEQR